MSIVTLLPFIVLIGAMFLMTRSAKRKQQAAVSMRNEMQPGSGVRTIGGMYATVKEVNEDTVLLEVAPGVHAKYAKNAIGAVLGDEEYDRIINGNTDFDAVVPDDASSLTEADESADHTEDGAERIDLGKKDVAPAEAVAPETEDAAPKKAEGDPEAK
ncbi:preprotein translocase subunit YajC [Streptomyces sp. NPDC007088]|uniref:preprotein translocase subunit YajC n=1 Tax=Streptomyces sp. NPDC007088 TaxID=3364773 RepID=UPI003697DAF6